ncbi:MAG: glutamate decarboxylase [Acidobacteria bacterium]|nr:glutamate decarboxylase [Acidobacteriota bacterium]
MVIKKMTASQLAEEVLAPAYTHRLDVGSMPKYRIPDHGALPDVAERLIHDELMLDGNARLNLATFVTTWMEPQAEKLMAETFDKNMIDKDEYPATAEIETRCTNIVADLFNAAEDGDAVGASTTGSSEAVMLGGLAMKWRWRSRREAAGGDGSKPNLILGSNVQVVWEKFCRYWDVEPRYVPVEHGRYVITPEEVVERIDENTIGVVAILGTTYTGEFEPIKEIHDAVVANNEATGYSVPVHVDAASGGFVAPFIHPDLEWDFRLPNVRSINVSGHKYGLVYPGVGFVVWQSEEDLPEELIFHVNYLGGDMPTFTLNFSRPGNQIVGQYYNFVRLGRSGYTKVMRALQQTATTLSSRIAEIGPFSIISDGTAIPVLSFDITEDVPYTVYDVSDRLRYHGWQVPAYTMPENATDVAVLRIVVREGFTLDLADSLINDLQDACDDLQANPPMKSASKKGFAH